MWLCGSAKGPFRLAAQPSLIDVAKVIKNRDIAKCLPTFFAFISPDSAFIFNVSKVGMRRVESAHATR